MLALPEKFHGHGICGVHGEVKPAQTFYGNDLFAAQARDCFRYGIGAPDILALRIP